MSDLKKRVTILIVTHSMQQAARLSDYTAFMYLGELLEFDRTAIMFSQPARQQTKDYVSGKIG
jgi:phosphate transport system ATP-binding protein